MNMGKIKGDILCNKVYEEHHTLKIEPLILLCESANISIEEFEQRYSPRFEDIVLQENITNWDDFHVSITLHDDPNMLNLDHEEFYPKSRGHCKVNNKNLKAYNRINVVAFNASVDLMRQHWKDMPDMSRFREDRMKIWPEFYQLREMIQYGDPQKDIEAFFPKCFKEHTILPSEVKGDKEKMIKFYTSVQSHRKFKVLDENDNEVYYDPDYNLTIEDALCRHMVEDTNYDLKRG